VDVVDEESGRSAPLKAEPEGYFSGWIEGSAGLRYRFRLDGEAGLLPDPTSCFQPDGPHGASMVVNHRAFAWTDRDWTGVPLERAIIYEMHIGTFTPEGSWTAATRQLEALHDLGVTVIEVLPVADFPGRFGWGYDGVNLFAPTRLYGDPDDMRRFVDRAHALGIAVILDVVYNHFGPDGNYLKQFAPAYFTDRYECEWGKPPNFDGDDSAPVREFYTANAAYWIDEFHLDGLRLDATQQIFDSSDEHILAAIGQAARSAAPERTILIVSENEPQDARLVRAVDEGGYGLDALWNDDFHHSAMVALTGRAEAYYSDYRGSAQELLACAKWGFLYQGQRYAWQKQGRGTASLDLPPPAFINFLQNHDQVANSGKGARGHALSSPGQWRAMTALLILMPGTPMLFQGQEFRASAPFLYFADHEPDLARLVEEGRRTFLSQFPSLTLPDVQALLASPADPVTFDRCKLDHAERLHGGHAEAWALHRDLLTLRREDSALSVLSKRELDGATLGEELFILRYFGGDSGDRLLIVNLGRDRTFDAIAEPLIAPPGSKRWSLYWSSEDSAYGGQGALSPEMDDGRWHLPGPCATLLRS